MRRLARGAGWVLLLSVAGVAIGVTAGVWQLGRAGEKRALEARFAAGSDAAPLVALVPGDPDPALRYRAIRLTGRYDAGHQVLLDNLSHQQRPGYQVLTPFVTAAGTVLVNRGWVPADGDRRVLPDVAVAAGPRDVEGRIDWLPRPAIELDASPPARDEPWPRRLSFPSIAELRDQLGVPLAGYQVLLDPAAPDGFIRQWQPGGISPERHVAYAVQWFGLAVTLVVFNLVLLARTRKTDP